MAYEVIPRRWRPKRFDEVLGQNHIVTTLKNSILFGRIGHAYLFSGPRGVGKTTLARIFAKALNCALGPTPDPCESCDICISITEGNFVDVIEIDAASARRIDDIRELREMVKYMPMRARYKVFILDEAHMLTGEAKDAFLKTLEEPPGHNIFILATTEPQKIPLTIMSRCQRFDFRKVPAKEILLKLKRICDEEKIPYDENALYYIAEEADGSLRDAESMLEKVISYSTRGIKEKEVTEVLGVVEKRLVLDLIDSVFKEEISQGFNLLSLSLEKGYDPFQVYKGLVTTLRNLLLVKIFGRIPEFLPLSEEDGKRIEEISHKAEYYEIQNMLNHLVSNEDLFRGSFPLISLEILYLNLYNLSQLKRITKLHTPQLPDFEKRSEDLFSQLSEDGRNILDDLRKVDSFLASLLESQEVIFERDCVKIIYAEAFKVFAEDPSFVRELKNKMEEVLKRKINLELIERSNQERHTLDDYLEEAKRIFNETEAL